MTPPLTFIHLSDTHIGPKGELQYQTDTAANLIATAERIRQMALNPVAIIMSGDRSNHGELESYTHFSEIVREHFEPLGAPILLGLGNHDLRLPFRQVILQEPDARDESHRYYYSQVIQDVRFIMLDSVIPGRVEGSLGPAQLRWLELELSQGAPAGSLVILHHPSIPRGVPRPDDFLLTDRSDFADVLIRHDVLGVLCGHSHVFTSAAFAGTLHVAAAATAYLLDPSIPDGNRGLEGCGFNVCSIRDGHLIVNPVTLPGMQRELFRHYLTAAAVPDREVTAHA